jgi:hypothetical protein
MIFFAELKLSTFLISSGAAFQSLVDEPIKVVLRENVYLKMGRPKNKKF